MVNARSAAKYAHILEAINADALPRFAAGGFIGASSASLPGIIQMHVKFEGPMGDKELLSRMRFVAETAAKRLVDNNNRTQPDRNTKFNMLGTV
jgi:hypothetical protein